MSDSLPNLTEFTKIVGDDKDFVLRIIQPGLAGLMDGSVSTLAPIFATAFATHNSHTVFLIGAASAVGAGISMAFSEGLSDDGEICGGGRGVGGDCDDPAQVLQDELRAELSAGDCGGRTGVCSGSFDWAVMIY
jgi:hypothetical protein